MSHKEALLSTAILGTAQQADFDVPCTDQLGDCLAQLHAAKSSLGTERLFLHIAALIWLYEKSGQRWTSFDGQRPQASEPDDKDLVSGPARTVLKQILDSQQDLLPEWIDFAKAKNKIVPNDLLCDVLELGAKNSELRLKLRACIGRRAEWLGLINPQQWGWASKFEIDLDHDQSQLQNAWDFGNLEQRQGALRIVRKIDPAKGLAMLRATWSDDTAEDRTKFLDCLVLGLSMDDEEFLETVALDDRRKEVRRKVQELLLRLPESRLSQRAWKIFLDCVSVKTSEGGNLLTKIFPGGKKLNRELEVKLPEACDKSMTRDGIVVKPGDYRFGERQWWLFQIVAYLSPRKILEHFQITEQELIELITPSEYMVVFRKALEEACLRHYDTEMAKAVMLQTVPENQEGLFSLLDSDEQEKVLIGMLENRSYLMIKQTESYYDSQAVNLLLKMSHRWSSNFSGAVLKSIRTHNTQKNHFIFMEHIMRHIGRHLDCDVWEGVASSWVGSGMHPAMEAMVSTLSLRREIRQSLE